MNIGYNLEQIWTIQKDFNWATALRMFHCREFLEFLPTFQALKQSKPFPIILDIGANVGDFAYACCKFWKRPEVYCFEPTPEIYSQLARRFKNQSFVHCYDLAITQNHGRIHFNSYENSKLSSVMELNPQIIDAGFGKNIKKDISVQSETLAEIINNTVKKDIDLIKIDVQGSEIETLASLDRAVYKIAYIQLELSPYESYKSAPKMHEVLKFMADRGYYLTHVHSPLINQKGIVVHIEGIFQKKTI